MQDSDSSGGGGAIVAIMFLVVLGLYFIPTIVAFVRHVPDRGTVIVLNLFLGWTFIGWVVALSMAARSRPPTMVVVPQPVMLGHASPQPGWYRDPSDPGAERWWDGVAWSEARRAPATPRSGPPAAHERLVQLGCRPRRRGSIRSAGPPRRRRVPCRPELAPADRSGA